jgi:prepilin-type N-terminal cleavage/methylation domain-containing protein
MRAPAPAEVVMLTTSISQRLMPSRAVRARTGSRGFTLVEILAVVVILGIASAIIIPNMGTRDDLRTAAGARQLVADLIYAQNQAITTGKMVYVKFDTTNNQYTLLTNANSGGDTAMTNPITQTTYVRSFGPNVSGWETVSVQSAVLNGTDATYASMFTLAFDELGSPYVFRYSDNTTNDLNSGSIVIQSGTFTSTVSVAPATGELTVN